MSIFSSPEEHAANPPETWVVGRTPRTTYLPWRLTTKNGTVLETSIRTKREAEALKVSGFWFNLYQLESRWYAGETILHWKPYVPKVVTS